MIEPMVSLAFALNSNRGAYAALVGSGVSVGAGIPTGWQVVLDLITKVAGVLGEDPGDDVAAWYEERFGEEPDYSKLLDSLAKSPAERSALLRTYFEPRGEDRSRGVKVPGVAHKALAQLAVSGHIKVFVTTNFDRLIEQALEEAGITPRVLSTPDDVLGSPPLSQSGVTVLKLHGDYLDTRMKNTPAELDDYHPTVDSLLDRIIDEHGFIVCGWSGVWDTALRRAFERSKTRRYTTYWADVVPPAKEAMSLIEHLNGEFLQVKGADPFLTGIVDSIKSLNGGSDQVAPEAQAQKAKNNLPQQLTSLVGREEELSAVGTLLAENRMVTLTGSGGSGKTRLAQEVASQNLDTYPDGVWLVSLAALVDPKLIVHEVSNVLGVGEEALYEYLGDKSALLILDNCEHLVGASADFATTLLQNAAGIKLLVTSQEVLEIPGETVHRVPSLTIPDASESSLEALNNCSAIRLFVERANGVQSEFELTAENAVAIVQITQRLDGIPLALELAAARVNVLSAEQIADRLDDAFRLLTKGTRSALPRQQTLRGALEWSYNLLSEPEKLLFDRLSVFRGGFSLEAAEEVCAGEGLDSYEVLDVLSQLIAKSLVVVEQDSDSNVRYRLLESMRLYSTERLAEVGDSEDVYNRHAAFFLTLAEEAEPQLITSQLASCLIRLERDYDNFRAAMTWGLASEDREVALKIASALTNFWIFHRHVGDGQAWLERAVQQSKDAPPVLRALLHARAALLHGKKLKDYERIREWLKESLRLGQEEDLSELMPELLYAEGVTAWSEGEFERLSKIFEDIRTLLEGVERTPFTDLLNAMGQRLLGAAVATHGDDQRTTEMFKQGLVSARMSGNQWATAYLLLSLGTRSADEAEYEKAKSYYDESLPLFREIDDVTGIACVFAGLGNVAWLQGDHEQALEQHRGSLMNFRNSREGSSIGFCLESLAGGVRPAGGLNELVERHNERLDSPVEEWSKEIIAEAAQRSGVAID